MSPCSTSAATSSYDAYLGSNKSKPDQMTDHTTSAYCSLGSLGDSIDFLGIIDPAHCKRLIELRQTISYDDVDNQDKLDDLIQNIVALLPESSKQRFTQENKKTLSNFYNKLTNTSIKQRITLWIKDAAKEKLGNKIIKDTKTIVAKLYSSQGAKELDSIISIICYDESLSLQDDQLTKWSDLIMSILANNYSDDIDSQFVAQWIKDLFTLSKHIKPSDKIFSKLRIDIYHQIYKSKLDGVHNLHTNYVLHELLKDDLFRNELSKLAPPDLKELKNYIKAKLNAFKLEGQKLLISETLKKDHELHQLRGTQPRAKKISSVEDEHRLLELCHAVNNIFKQKDFLTEIEESHYLIHHPISVMA